MILRNAMFYETLPWTSITIFTIGFFSANITISITQHPDFLQFLRITPNLFKPPLLYITAIHREGTAWADSSIRLKVEAGFPSSAEHHIRLPVNRPDAILN